jgi:hypothetical protein
LAKKSRKNRDDPLKWFIGLIFTAVIAPVAVDWIKRALNKNPNCPECNEQLNIDVNGNFYCNRFNIVVLTH